MGDKPQYLAVYGSLRRGCPANGYLKGCEYVGQDAVSARLYKLGWYPGVKLIETGGNHNTVVDVYKLPSEKQRREEIVAAIDMYEGFVPNDPSQSLFERKTVTLLNDPEKETFIYEYCFDVREDTLIEDGDWINALSNSPSDP